MTNSNSKKIWAKKSEPNYTQENKTCSCKNKAREKKFKVQSGNGMQGVKGIMLSWEGC